MVITTELKLVILFCDEEYLVYILVSSSIVVLLTDRRFNEIVLL